MVLVRSQFVRGDSKALLACKGFGNGIPVDLRQEPSILPGVMR